MPLFRRPDGDLVRDLPNVRRIMPYIMPGRNESAIYHHATYDLSRTLPWLAKLNATRETKATLFHLFVHACARALHERPGLNRFVSGGRVYQRRGVWISFVAKKAFEDQSPFVTLKVEIPKDASFAEVASLLHGSIGEGRGGKKTSVDTELKLALALPSPLLRMAVALLRWLDQVNLMPGGMIRSDPMYASLFAANLGSVGIGDTFHHLYEYGTVSLFGVLGKIEGDRVGVNWTFDERINDGFYCASSLKIAQAIVEDPEAHIQ